MRMSDLVAEYINRLIDSQDGAAEIRRNELAAALGCAPSQINYVITSRFTPEHGYIVESRRGGGGFIRITRIRTTRSGAVMHIVNAVGRTLDKSAAEIMLANMLDREIIDARTARLMAAALSDRALADVPQAYRDAVRAALFKNMLINTIE